MKNKKKYVTNDFVFTNELVDNYKLLNGLSTREYAQYLIIDFATSIENFFHDKTVALIKEYIKDHLKIDLKEGTLITDFKDLIPPKLYDEYIVCQLNHFFKRELNGYENEEGFKKDIENEELAFYINLNSLNTDFHHKKAKEHPNPLSLLEYYNDKLYDISDDENLIQKLSKGKKNAFYKHVKKTHRYLKEIPATNIKTKLELIIPEEEIIKLKKLDGIIWDDDIIAEDFISYWRLGQKQSYLPIKNGMQTTFVYIIYSYFIQSNGVKPKYTQAQLEEAFNIKRIKALKQDIKPNTLSIKKVRELLGLPNYRLK